MEYLKVQKVDDVRFAILQDVADVKVDICLKEGEIYLSISDIYFKEGEKWYEIPLKKLEEIEVLNKDPPELEFKIPSLKVKVEGEYAEKMMALRYLLLPYIEYYREKGDNKIRAVLKVWEMGIRRISAIADLLDLTESEVIDYIEEAREKNLLDGNEITPKGKRLLNASQEIENMEG